VASRQTIGIIGGTGAAGRGVATRLAAAGHPVVVGSREDERARATAETIAAKVGPRPGSRPPASGTNGDAAMADIVFLCVPHAAQLATLDAHRERLAGRIVVDLTVPLHPPPRRGVARRVPGGSAAQAAQARLTASRVVAAFHTVPASLLADLDALPDCDVLVCGDDTEAKAVVIGLAGAMGLRGLDAGPLANAATLEGLAAILLGLNRRYGSRHASVRVTHLGPQAGSA
jgi:hypothetical protein